MRITKSEVRGMFERLCRAMNMPEDHGSYNGLSLDYYSVGGGYRIDRYHPEKGCDQPFGTLRRSAREMYLSMLMTAQVLEEIRYKQNMEI
jgi:hypothetical protein